VPHTPPMRRPLLLALSLLALTACNNAPSQSAPLAPRPALVVTAGDIAQPGPAYIAEVRAVSRAELAFAVSGRVARLHADVGNAVRAGQLLAELDTTPLRAQLQAASSEETAARVRWQEVRQRHSRIHAAQLGQAISAGEMDAVKAELAAAAAALDAASAQRSQAEWALAQASLRAPVDGVIGSRQLAVGQSASPGANVFSIEGSGRELALWLPASVKLAIGQRVALQHEQALHNGKVLRIAATLGAGGQRQVFISAPAQAQPGDTWQVLLGRDSDAGINIPLRALLPGNTTVQNHVLRLGEDGRTVEKVTVITGEVQDDRIQIIKGLKAEDMVVVAGANAIAPGTRVTPVLLRDGGSHE
jgi:RND family efflux transporter MFP subunit